MNNNSNNNIALEEYEKAMLRTAKSCVPIGSLPYALAAEEHDEAAMQKTRECLLNAVLGLVGETGEFTDLIKKWQFHQHDLDLEKIVLELGDIHWYWSYLCYIFNVNPDTVLRMNVAKLQKRYPEGFSTEDSKSRVDVNE